MSKNVEFSSKNVEKCRKMSSFRRKLSKNVEISCRFLSKNVEKCRVFAEKCRKMSSLRRKMSKNVEFWSKNVEKCRKMSSFGQFHIYNLYIGRKKTVCMYVCMYVYIAESTLPIVSLQNSLKQEMEFTPGRNKTQVWPLTQGKGVKRI